MSQNDEENQSEECESDDSKDSLKILKSDLAAEAQEALLRQMHNMNINKIR